MRLIFCYGNTDKTVVNDLNKISRDKNIKRLTPQNKKFLQLLGLTVISEYSKK